MRPSADAVVIGGGVVGAAIAYNLLKSGMKSVVLCEKSTFASGSTGRCGAGVREQWGAEHNIRLAKASIDMFEHLAEELGYDQDIEFKQKGYLILAHTEKEWDQFKKNVELQHRLGVNSMLLTPEEAKDIVPALNTEGMLGATYNSRDGHANPFHTTRAFLQAARRLGGDICFFTEVTAIELEAGKVKRVRTSRGDISSPVLVNAAGPWAAVVAKMVGVDLPVYTQRHQILVTEPVGWFLDPMVMSFSIGIYCQQTPHGSVVMGIGDPDEPKGYDTGHSWQFLREMASIVCRLLPVLRDVRVVRQWSGLYTMTPDAHPILGKVPGVDGYYQAVGFSGHGFMLAPVVGRLLSEMILGKQPFIDISGLDLGRFERGEYMVEPSVV
ncbi:MAG: FAD-binding oxidoreductase [Candidatus Fermentithermobacillus carboniphilus]|uniref:FAD-binding oxidoreductase n=1 Tax=Candidatus Fermentithermobacillus carboniphilus TaxID=3085328 RepID=A0AAT9LF15_9FIRM|nr:MAG: FAD-binding oxidoreductase [Candidatus Fermentithermobacillus carboniphilus]